MSKQLQPTIGPRGRLYCLRLFLHGCRDFVALGRILGAIALLAMPALRPAHVAAQGPPAAASANKPAEPRPAQLLKVPRTSEQSLPAAVLDIGQAVSAMMPMAELDSSARMPGISGDAMSVGTVIANWRFGRAEDTDYDGWPEGWQRRRDREHPPYLPMKLVAKDASIMQSAQAADLRIMQAWPLARKSMPKLPSLPPSLSDLVVDRHFRIELDGGWAMVQSNPVPIDALYRYRLELSARSEELVHDHAFAELVFLDAQGEPIVAHATNSLLGSKAWTPIETELLSVPTGAVAVAVRLALRPLRPAAEFDIRGAAGFDDILIRRLPQMRISTDNPFAIYNEGQRPEISVRVLGLDRNSQNVHFIVRDVAGRQVAEQTVVFQEVAVPDQAEPNSSRPNKSAEEANTEETIIKSVEDIEQTAAPAKSGAMIDNTSVLKLVSTAAGLPNKSAATTELTGSSELDDIALNKKNADAIEGVATWKLPPLRPGFYVVQSLLGDPLLPSLSNETTLAILGSLPTAAVENPYGWTLPRTTLEVAEMKRLPDWLHRLGVGVVKFPCWYEPGDQASLDAAAWLVGHLQDNNIRTIGMLDVPPASVLAKINEKERREPTAANYFRDPAVWPQLLEPIMTRLSLKVRTWQLGADGDYSFLGRSPLKQTIKEIGRDLQGFGQPIGIAFSWPWLEPLPPASERSWGALNLATNTPLASDELDAYLQSIESNESSDRDSAETWVSLNPLDAKLYDRQTRVADLVLRMTTVRGHRVPAAFVSNPLDSKQGLLRDDWRPGEMLLPFRTTSLLIGDLKRVGTLPMRKGSSTVVLANALRTTIVIWNPTPITEVVYFGDNLRQVDVWGNTVQPKKITVEGKPFHEISVGPMPTFLVDVDPVLVAFRMSTQLVEKSLDSLLNRRQTVTLQFVNPTQDTLSGEVRIRQIDDWIVDSRPQAFDLGPSRTAKHEFDVSLRNSAKIGTSNLEFEFLLRTQPQRRFTVSREIHVGPEGLDIEVTTRLNDGELLVFLTMVNRTETAQQYDCMIFPPGGGQYQRRQVIVPADSTVKRLFPWQDGRAMVGQKMLLRAVEQNGDRVLNQVVEVLP